MSEVNLQTLADEIRTRLFDPALTLQGRLADALRRFAALEFPEDRVSAAEEEIKQFEPRAISIIATDDRTAAARLIGALGRVGLELSTPPVIPSAQDQVSAISDVLTKMGWSPLEMDLVIRELKVGEAIIGYDRLGVHTDAPRTISRRELREKYRPVNWTNTRSWSDQFSQYPIDGDTAADLAPSD